MSINCLNKFVTKTCGNVAKNIAKTSTIAETSNVAKKFAKKTVVSEELFKSLRLCPEENPVATVLRKADRFLRASGAKINAEVPIEKILQDVPKGKRKAVANLLGNPDTVHLRAKHNGKGKFSILGFRATKGNKDVAKGAFSITDFGQPDAVAKWRISAGQKGKNIRANGFIDAAQSVAPQNLSVVPSYADRMLGCNVRLDNAFASNIKVNAKKALPLLPEGQLGNIAGLNTGTEGKLTKLNELLGVRQPIASNSTFIKEV